MKRTSTVLEPSIPFNTLVHLVDAEDIARDKLRTHDFTLEVISKANHIQSQNLGIQQHAQLIFTLPRDPSNKHETAF